MKNKERYNAHIERYNALYVLKNKDKDESYSYTQIV